MPANPLTADQLAEAALLKSIFKEWQHRQRESGNKISQEVAGDMVGFGQSALSQYLNGKIPLNVDAATKIATLIGCAVSDFSLTLARQAANYAACAAVSIAHPHKQIPAESEIEIPQYKDVGGSMGLGVVLRDQPGEIHGWRVTSDWVSKNVKHHSGVGNLAIVTGFGDSMRPLFNPGDPLLVDSGVKSVDFDSIYFFRIGDEGFIKRLQRVPGEGLMAISENKAYRDWAITSEMDFEVFARVIKVWCGTDF